MTPAALLMTVRECSYASAPAMPSGRCFVMNCAVQRRSRKSDTTGSSGCHTHSLRLLGDWVPSPWQKNIPPALRRTGSEQRRYRGEARRPQFGFLRPPHQTSHSLLIRGEDRPPGAETGCLMSHSPLGATSGIGASIHGLHGCLGLARPPVFFFVKLLSWLSLVVRPAPRGWRLESASKERRPKSSDVIGDRPPLSRES